MVLVEKEKAKALDDVKEAQRLSEEANEKLREALVAQKQAEENTEIEKFRSLEMEQVDDEASQTKEEEWKKDLEAVRNQHAVDVVALLSASQELQKLKQELAMTCDAKNQALIHAEDATKLAEIHVEKVKSLSEELVHLKGVLDSRIELEAAENNKLVSDLKLEINSLRQELEKMKTLEEKLAEKEAAFEQINVDLEAAKMAECYARKLVEELHERVEELTSQAEEAKRLEKSASESLESVKQQLGESNDLLCDAESEIALLKEKVSEMEISSGRQKGDFEESMKRLELAKDEAIEMVKKVEFLESELEVIEEEKTRALNNEKLATARVETLLEEKDKLVNELETSRDEEEKSKTALESLASALHEVSSDARDAKEKLISLQRENDNNEAQIEDLRMVLKETKEKYEYMLDEAKQDIDALTNSIEQSKHEYHNLKAELEEKELHLTNSVKKYEEGKSGLENEIDRLVDLLKLTEQETSATREEGDRWKNSFKEAESEVTRLKEVLGEVKAESMTLKDGLIERESELQKTLLENEVLRKREMDSLIKAEVLSKQLEEALAKKNAEENLELTDSEKDYDVLPKWTSFMQLPEKEKKPSDSEANHVFSDESAHRASETNNSNGKPQEGKEKEEDKADSAEVGLQMWESCKIDEKDLSPEDETESRAEGGHTYDQVNGVSSTENLENGGISPSKSSSEKKKKPLLRKFGSLLKKKSTSTQK